MKVNKLISSVCLFRVQTLTSSTNPRTRCPAGSISLWPLMTPCPCRRMPTHHVCPLWTSPLLKCQGPKSLLDCDAAVSASPPSPSTWRPPQRCRRSRGMFLTLSCQAARTPTPAPGSFFRRDSHTFPTLLLSFTSLKTLSVLFRCCCRAWDALPSRH